MVIGKHRIRSITVDPHYLKQDRFKPIHDNGIWFQTAIIVGNDVLICLKSRKYEKAQENMRKCNKVWENVRKKLKNNVCAFIFCSSKLGRNVMHFEFSFVNKNFFLFLLFQDVRRRRMMWRQKIPFCCKQVGIHSKFRKKGSLKFNMTLLFWQFSNTNALWPTTRKGHHGYIRSICLERVVINLRSRSNLHKPRSNILSKCIWSSLL